MVYIHLIHAFQVIYCIANDYRCRLSHLSSCVNFTVSSPPKRKTIAQWNRKWLCDNLCDGFGSNEGTRARTQSHTMITLNLNKICCAILIVQTTFVYSRFVAYEVYYAPVCVCCRHKGPEWLDLHHMWCVCLCVCLLVGECDASVAHTIICQLAECIIAICQGALAHDHRLYAIYARFGCEWIRYVSGHIVRENLPFTIRDCFNVHARTYHL